MDDDFLVGSFWATLIAGLVLRHFNTAYENMWFHTIPSCTARGGDLLLDCGHLIEQAASYQKWATWALWIMAIAGVCLFFAAISFITDLVKK